MANALCKHCGEPFNADRAGAQYCSVAHRVAAHRLRLQPKPEVSWWGKAPELKANRELGEGLLRIAREADGGAPKTGRRFYYLALMEGLISPSMEASKEAAKSRDAAYKRVGNILKALRKSDNLDWNAVLDLTRELVEWQTYRSAREARAAIRRRYEGDRWLGQKFYPIVLVEKDTMEPVVKPIASRWRMPFASSRGYGSLTLEYDVARMLIARHAETGQVGKVYFISDLDPSGLDLQRAWEDALNEFCGRSLAKGKSRYTGTPFTLERIGLTLEQVETVVPPGPARDGIAVKPSDTRAKRYVAEYGDRCWEADVLPASVIEQAIDSAICEWLDLEQWKRVRETIERERALL